MKYELLWGIMAGYFGRLGVAGRCKLMSYLSSKLRLILGYLPVILDFGLLKSMVWPVVLGCLAF